MHLSVSHAMLATIISSCCVYAQHIGTIEHTHVKQMKYENALIITWESNSNDAKANQVEIFDEQGRPVISLNVLRPVQEAMRVSIYDVSANPKAMIAVAAVYAKEGKHVRPTSSLLLFDFNGRLLSAFALDPSRGGIWRLAVDDKSNVWTLTAYADNKDPSTIPMLAEYTAEGTVARELLTRSLFPFHAEDMKEDSFIGRATMGYDSGVLWFWLPVSTDLVTVSADGGEPVITKTQLPKRVGRKEVLLNIVRESSGNMVAEVREDGAHGESDIAYYTWSPLRGSWLQFKPGACDSFRPIGANNGQIYVWWETGGDRIDICRFLPK